MDSQKFRMDRETAMLNPYEIRRDFPILQESIGTGTNNPLPLVYLDNAATTQKPMQVIEAMVHYYTRQNANVHRAIYDLGHRATVAYEATRAKVAEFIGRCKSHEIVFTRGTTDGINLVAAAWGRKFVKPGSNIVLTEMEHHSNLIPWQLLAREKNVELRFIPFDLDGYLDLSQIDRIITEETALVAVTHVSNVFGTINPIEDIIRKAHDKNIPVLVDAAQSVPHLPIQVRELDCDFLVFSGHKMCGPTGIGVLYAKEKWLEAMDPYQGGGDMISAVWLDHAEWNELPYKFEAGTPNIAGVIGLGAAIDYLNKVGMEQIALYEREIARYALARLREIDSLRIIGIAPNRGAVVSFCLADIHPHDIAQFLNNDGIAIRSGHHCAQPLMRKLNIAATARASFYFYNTREEIDKLVTSLSSAKDFFTRRF